MIRKISVIRLSCMDFTTLKPYNPNCQDKGQTLTSVAKIWGLILSPPQRFEHLLLILIPYAKRAQVQSQMDVARNPSPALTSHSGSFPPEKTASVEESTY